MLDVELASSCVSAYVLSLGSPPGFTELDPPGFTELDLNVYLKEVHETALFSELQISASAVVLIVGSNVCRIKIHLFFMPQNDAHI